MKNKDNTKIKQFRLRGKKLLLTYSELNINSVEHIKTLILEQLGNKLPKIIQYIIAKEKCQNGDLYYYIYLEFNTKVELYGINCLDLKLNGISYHGNYKTISKKDSTIRYIIKNKKFIAEPPLNIIDGELYLNFKEYLIKLYEKKGKKGLKNYLEFINNNN